MPSAQLAKPVYLSKLRPTAVNYHHLRHGEGIIRTKNLNSGSAIEALTIPALCLFGRRALQALTSLCPLNPSLPLPPYLGLSTSCPHIELRASWKLCCRR